MYTPKIPKTVGIGFSILGFAPFGGIVTEFHFFVVAVFTVKKVKTAQIVSFEV